MEALDDVLAHNWWVILLRGLVGILFGLTTLLVPGLTFAALVLVFGAYAFADGVLAIVSAFRRGAPVKSRWIHALKGLLGIIAGVLTLLWPDITAVALLVVVASWSLVSGVLELVAAVRLRKVITGEWLLALSGIASIALSVLLMLFPAAGALTLTLWIGAYALTFGVILLALSFRLRAWAKDNRALNPRSDDLAHRSLSGTSSG